MKFRAANPADLRELRQGVNGNVDASQKLERRNVPLLADSYQRKFVYLRLSVTDRCNFRCVYCLPNGYQAAQVVEPELSIDEVRRLVTGFASTGIWKVRLTGGEPMVRRDIVEIAQAVSRVPGISQVSITTNGTRLASLAIPLRSAGVNSVNISVDSLDEDNFKKMTGTDRFQEVMTGVDCALDAGFEKVKVNAVLFRGSNDHEFSKFTDWVRNRPISVRFIELMRTGKNRELFQKHHISGGTVQLELLKSGWSPLAKSPGDGPAVVYGHPKYQGTIGIIAPYSTGFCNSCNRLRVSSRGALRLCLFGEKDESLRNYLSDDSMHPQLVSKIHELVSEKPATHFLHEGKYGNTWNLAGIGG